MDSLQPLRPVQAASGNDAGAVNTLWLLNGSSIDQHRLEALSERLGSAEQQRLQRFLRPQRARQFLLGRLLLRHAVCHTLAVTNRQIIIDERDGAAPILAIDDHPDVAPCHFSLSHSHDWIACATSVVAPLGVDIESLAQPRDFAALAAAAFDVHQQAWWQQQAAAQRAAAFYRLWNCQEALVKLGAHATSEGCHCRLVEHPHLAVCLCSAASATSLNVIEVTQL